MNYREIVNNQKKFFYEDEIKKVEYRITKLKMLKKVIKEKEEKICKALEKDLGKSNIESYMCEIGMVLEDLGYIIKNVKKWSKEKNVRTPIAQFLAKSYRKPVGYGSVLILSPWNYPFLLSIQPLVGAIAAGNCVILKPSEFSPNTSNIIKEIIEEVFEERYVKTILGDNKVANDLLKQEFDYIFYTGSTRVGKIVMEEAAKKLIPVTLELGGKSPCIVTKDANLKLAAKRIIFGKLLNAGQTCVAPDYIFVDNEIKKEFINYLIKYIKDFLGEKVVENKEYPKIINKKQFERLINIIKEEKIIYGGNYNKEQLKIEPTIVEGNVKSKAMQEEIFGPIMPIIGYDKIEDVIKYIIKNPKPLALYLFTKSKKIEKIILNKIQFGGGCINDTVIHLANSKLGFGGIGNSGMGEYHGKKSFETFTHYTSIVKKSNLIDMPMRYHPYKKINEKIIKMVMK